jgi:hypothetical protein
VHVRFCLCVRKCASAAYIHCAQHHERTYALPRFCCLRPTEASAMRSSSSSSLTAAPWSNMLAPVPKIASNRSFCSAVPALRCLTLHVAGTYMITYRSNRKIVKEKMTVGRVEGNRGAMGWEDGWKRRESGTWAREDPQCHPLRTHPSHHYRSRRTVEEKKSNKKGVWVSWSNGQVHIRVTYFS